MTRKHTGGNWDPSVHPYWYFTAGTNPAQRKALALYRTRLLAVNELGTPEALTEDLEPLLTAGVPVLLDSGVFWLANSHATTHHMPMDQALGLPPHELDDWETLYTNYCHLVTRYGSSVWGYIELDQGGIEHKRRTRAGLESQGFAPIPVYHPFNDGWDYFDELCQNYDRICLGNVVQASPAVRLRLFATIWERGRHYPEVWIHCLGVTPTPLQLGYPLHSCDSSTWLSGVRWPNLGRWADACLQGLGGNFEREFFYQRDEPNNHSRVHAGKCLAYHAAMVHRTWQEILMAYKKLGFDPSPPRHARERMVTPSHS